MIPVTARRTLEEGVLCYLGVRTPDGPHVTPVVYALDGSRLWVTTARTSVKARVVRAGSEVAGLVRSGDVVVCFGVGPSSTTRSIHSRGRPSPSRRRA